MKKSHVRKSYEHRNDLAGEFKWGDIGQIIFLFVFVIGLISDLLLFNFSNFIQNFFPWYFQIIIFLFLFFTAGYFSQRSHKIIFQEERKGLIIIKSDVYARIRHPMYFGFILIYLAFVILSLSIIAFIIFIIICIFYYYISRYEEQLLIEKIGDEYKDYMKKVPMFIPKLRK